DLYRRDPAVFREQWRALRPGQRLEIVWYPNSKELNFHDAAALKEGYAAGKLVRWSSNARKHGLVLGDIAPLDPANAFQYKGLRPEAMGALYRIATCTSPMAAPAPRCGSAPWCRPRNTAPG